MAKRECREWGFDLTTFKSRESFQKVLDKHRLDERQLVCVKPIGKKLSFEPPFKKTNESDEECSLIKYRWTNKDGSLILDTTNDPKLGCYSIPWFRAPEKGYASSMGVSGDPNKVKALVKDIRKAASFIKEESRCKRDFI